MLSIMDLASKFASDQRSAAGQPSDSPDGMTIYHFPTSKHSYLYKYKCMEFSFLDDMRLTGAIPQPRGRGRRLEINRLPHGFRLILFRSRPLRFKAAVRIFRNWFEVVIGNLWE